MSKMVAVVGTVGNVNELCASQLCRGKGKRWCLSAESCSAPRHKQCRPSQARPQEQRSNPSILILVHFETLINAAAKDGKVSGLLFVTRIGNLRVKYQDVGPCLSCPRLIPRLQTLAVNVVL